MLNIGLQTCDGFVVVRDVKLVRSDILRFVVEVEGAVTLLRYHCFWLGHSEEVGSVFEV